MSWIILQSGQRCQLYNSELYNTAGLQQTSAPNQLERFLEIDKLKFGILDFAWCDP